MRVWPRPDCSNIGPTLEENCMRKYIISAVVIVLGVGGLVVSQNSKKIRMALTGYAEIPTLSTSGNGIFNARIGNDGGSIDYELSYSDTESPVTQSHIHFGERWL